MSATDTAAPAGDAVERLVNHPQWEIIEGAIQRRSAGIRDADYTLGIVDYGLQRLLAARRAALAAGVDQQAEIERLRRQRDDEVSSAIELHERAEKAEAELAALRDTVRELRSVLANAEPG